MTMSPNGSRTHASPEPVGCVTLPRGSRRDASRAIVTAFRVGVARDFRPRCMDCAAGRGQTPRHEVSTALGEHALDRSFLFMAGPCVIESAEMTRNIAARLKALTAGFPVEFYFKASYDKANRTSLDSYRGPGLVEGLRILAEVKRTLGVRLVSDVHSVDQVAPAAEVLDMIQIPAFLCRQTDLVVEAARTGKPINVKKAQFMAPYDMRYVVDKIEATGNRRVILTERGATFGYHNLVVDFRSFSIMRAFGHPVVFDATHAVQIPSQGGTSRGNREYVVPLARAAVAYGVDGLFCETHPEPEKALSDAANSLPLDHVEPLLKTVFAVRDALSAVEAGQR
jgi:2-dehydro-3-deoxyphosphooctonate aldolase (KDO 8-P synthase)